MVRYAFCEACKLLLKNGRSIFFDTSRVSICVYRRDFWGWGSRMMLTFPLTEHPPQLSAHRPALHPSGRHLAQITAPLRLEKHHRLRQWQSGRTDAPRKASDTAGDHERNHGPYTFVVFIANGDVLRLAVFFHVEIWCQGLFATCSRVS